MPLAGRLETELVLLPCAVPSALCWKSQPEPLQGFGDQKRTDAPQHRRAHGSAAPRMLGGSRSYPGSVPEYLWVSPVPAASADVGQGRRGLLELCKVWCLGGD